MICEDLAVFNRRSVSYLRSRVMHAGKCLRMGEVWLTGQCKQAQQDPRFQHVLQGRGSIPGDSFTSHGSRESTMVFDES